MAFGSLVRTSARRSKGQVIILLATFATILLGLGGLAVDLVLVYSVQTFLSTATDSAAMGGVRALERGVTYEDQALEVQRLTDMLFDANFPNGILLTGNTGMFSGVTVAAKNMDPTAGPMFETDPDLAPGMREIRVESVAQAPTFFMRVFGVESVTVRAGAYAARRDVNIMVVIDRSGSLKQAGAWDDVQNAAIAFIEQFDNNRDRVGVVTFGSGANVDFPLANGFKTNNAAKNLILAQTVPDGAATNSPLGMWLAYSELLRVNDPDALNAIVFFTDGQPSAFTASFGMRVAPLSGPRCSTPQVEGVLASSQDPTSAEFKDIYGLWKRQAGPVPVNGGSTSHDWEMTGTCFNLGSPAYYGLQIENAFDPAQTWPAAWTATESGGISKTFCIQPGAGGCEGDLGDFTYSVTDSRLYNDSGTTSNKVFRGTNLHNAAKNLSLNIAQAARRDATLGGVNVHAIGLGGWGYPADAALMKRMANDPSDSYGVTIAVAANEPQGSYTYAPNAGDLQEAFNKVRSEVARLTR